MTEKIILGFGSNRGRRIDIIRSAVRLISLDANFDRLALSSVYETEPWGFSDQNKFLNCAGIFLCRLAPAELLSFLKKIENKLGRIKRDKWQAREIDVDVLYYGSYIIRKKNLVIPHPHVSKRNFVLAPLVELVPGYTDPVSGKTIKYMAANSQDKCRVVKYRKKI
jgi:2-amino-4-hydroxy-6-hydroxymethyldihydropteridine diphosphokinase